MLSDDGWLVAEHYCYLGDADGERIERVLSEAVFGSLMGRLAAADPSLLTEHRPRFTADEDTLLSCIRRSLSMEPKRKIALVIDGIDHVTRVRARRGDPFDPSRGLAESLAVLELPPGAVLIVLSQPGSHLEPLERVGAQSCAIPGLTRDELESLAARLNVIPATASTSALGPPLIQDREVVIHFLDALTERSDGNALYATYLCRETVRNSDSLVDPATNIRNMPQFDGTLKNYYNYLHQALGTEAGWVADVIALVNFSVTRAELRQIRPDAAHRVDGALALLAPVLIERATQGGVRVYHESFARYLSGVFDDNTYARKALLERIASWLEGKGFFTDPRSFRSLLSILAEAGNDRQVIDLVDRTFVTRAVAAGFPSSAIASNLAAAAGSAARLGEWAVVVRCVELARAADSYQSERFDSTLVAFADVPAKLLGADTFAARLVDDDRLVMPARAGLQMCAAVDRLGATAPWLAYMEGHLREAKSDNLSYGEAENSAVALAWMRGRLRLSATFRRSDAVGAAPHSDSHQVPLGTVEHREWGTTDPIDWRGLGAWIEERRLPMRSVLAAVADTHGSSGVYCLIQSLCSPGEACLAFAERLANESPLGGDSGNLSPRIWAIAAVAHGIVLVLRETDGEWKE